MTLNNVAVFFDRDGTINTEVDFLREPGELELIPDAAQAIREANETGVKVFVITNQSGIARGFLTERELHRVHRKLRQLLATERARIDEIFYCPHHPVLGAPPYNVDCECRKPKTGMLQRAAQKHRVDLSRSFVVGDRCVDMQAGVGAGCGTVLVLTGYGQTEKTECMERSRVDHVARDAYRAWEYIRHKLGGRSGKTASQNLR